MCFWFTLATLVAAALAAEPGSDVPGERATEDPPPTEVAPIPAALPPEPTPADRLQHALLAYQAGQPEAARVALAALVNDPTNTDRELRQQARVYLGELLYVGGQQDAAFKAFEMVLQDAPDYRIDPFLHPPDVCGFFEVVRASMAPARPSNPVQITPLRFPANGYAGFGLYQLAHDQTGRGTVFLVGETAMGLTSVLTHALLLADRRYSDSEKRQKLVALRTVQWATTAGFYGFYAWSTIDARVNWREEVSAETALLPPEPSGLGLGYTGHW